GRFPEYERAHRERHYLRSPPAMRPGEPAPPPRKASYPRCHPEWLPRKGLPACFAPTPSVHGWPANAPQPARFARRGYPRAAASSEPQRPAVAPRYCPPETGYYLAPTARPHLFPPGPAYA